ncbi:MAG: type II secretion system protein [archaeon]|jgi:prepilin-type N-terminal cleavage/methylation domain-containing protein
MKMFLKKQKRSRSRGFTLIELLISISIFVVLTGVVLFSQNSFDDTILLNNLAYDVALTVRQAQTYGVNGKESSLGTFSAYGVYFDLNPDGSNKSFVLFADTDNSSSTASVIYCPANDPECLQKYTIKRGNYIKKLCAGDNATYCYNLPVVSIVFRRPNPGAYIYDITSFTIPKNYAEIVVASANGAEKTIVVTSVGQIYVK